MFGHSRSFTEATLNDIRDPPERELRMRPSFYGIFSTSQKEVPSIVSAARTLVSMDGIGQIELSIEVPAKSGLGPLVGGFDRIYP